MYSLVGNRVSIRTVFDSYWWESKEKLYIINILEEESCIVAGNDIYVYIYPSTYVLELGKIESFFFFNQLSNTIKLLVRFPLFREPYP